VADSTCPTNEAAPVFTTNGKEVLRDGIHFADATTPADAEQIAAALDGVEHNGYPS